jgi:DUF971 family protein
MTATTTESGPQGTRASAGVPTDLRVRAIGQSDDRTLSIDWTDGRIDEYDVVSLRRNCPCAACVDEMTNRRTLKPEDVPDSVRPVRLESIGSYAIQIYFNDGHSTGYYTYPYLRELALEEGPNRRR